MLTRFKNSCIRSEYMVSIELGEKEIGVICCFPGDTPTPMTFKYDTQEQADKEFTESTGLPPCTDVK